MKEMQPFTGDIELQRGQPVGGGGGDPTSGLIPIRVSPLRSNPSCARFNTQSGGVLVSTRSSLRVLHAEDDSLAS